MILVSILVIVTILLFVLDMWFRFKLGAISRLRGRNRKARVSTTLESIIVALLSLTLLGASLYIILSDSYSQDVQKWAFGIIGSLIGYWFRRGKG